MASSSILDTNCLIWFQENNPKIPKKVMAIIQDPGNLIFFSQVSLFEMAIKQNIGKLPDFKADTDEIYHQALKDDLTFLSIQNKHLLNYQKLPLPDQHRDPFDRLLIATAHEEDAVVLTADKSFKLYPNFIKVIGDCFTIGLKSSYARKRHNVGHRGRCANRLPGKLRQCRPAGG